MKRILVVDDSLVVARHYEMLFSGSDEFCVAGHAKNGAEALKLFMEAQPDIVCMDMTMPEMDGITALRSLMKIDPEARVVMVTSLGGVGEKFNEAIRLGARGVISKPFDTEQVLQVLRSL